MFKLLKLKWQKELEELKSIHRIQLAEKDAALDRTKKDLFQTHELDLKEAITLLKLESQQKTKQLELDFLRKIDELKAEQNKANTEFRDLLSKEYYDKLSAAMSKLHEEGNLTTKFTQDLALKMFEHAPETKVRVLTNGDKSK